MSGLSSSSGLVGEAVGRTRRFRTITYTVIRVVGNEREIVMVIVVIIVGGNSGIYISVLQGLG